MEPLSFNVELTGMLNVDDRSARVNHLVHEIIMKLRKKLSLFSGMT